MTQEELNVILDKHSKWLNGEMGWEQANLRGANLQGAYLRWADLRETDLKGANLRGANLQGAYLQKIDLQRADLREADLQFADLRGANIQEADLQGANLTGAKTFGTILNLQCPEEGSFIAWKKLGHGAVAKLLIPEDAKRSSATSRKCRASKAVVLEIYNINGERVDEERSQADSNFIYRVGETVYPDSWDEDRWNECSNGIHFFITRKEAEEY